jgi:peptide/nickel transport system substrate-binding protein
VPNRIVHHKVTLAPIALVSMLAVTALGMVLSADVARAASVPNTFIEPPVLASKVVQGKLPPVAKRLPDVPAVVDFNKPYLKLGRHGGNLRILMGSGKDVRQMIVYGYARLVGYDRDFNLAPDLLESYDIKEGRIFTFRIRKGHKWSDGHPFTAEDFRYYWEDMANNKKMAKGGVTRELMLDGVPPKFEVIDSLTVRYSWPKPNPFFLHYLAKPSPLYIFRPAHYLRQFHAKYADPVRLEALRKKRKRRNWVALHYRMDRQYRNDNTKLPTLEPWVIKTKPPSERFIFARNPYFHKVDPEGRQLPYIDQVVMSITNSKLISAKAGSGEADLQARGVQFSNYTFLKKGEKRNDFTVVRWQAAKGAHMALYPNLNTSDPVWRKLFRTADFRRAISLGVNRHEINQAIFFGLALEGNNTVLPKSSFYKVEYAKKWATYDLKRANALLDGLGLTKRSDRGLRLLPDGRPMEIIVETAGEDSEQIDVLQLISDSWLKLGIKIFPKPLQREVFRKRVFAGSALMSVWFGLENGVPTWESSPAELAPTVQQQLQWPKWGLYNETKGRAGEPPDAGPAKQLLDLFYRWRDAESREEKRTVWAEMLAIHADQVYSIGLVSAVPQPVVVNNNLRNVPKAGIYNWDPGAHFGVHRPEVFWFEK